MLWQFATSHNVFLIIFVFKKDSFVSERDLAMASLPHSGFCKHEQNFLLIFRADFETSFCFLLLSANRARLSSHSVLNSKVKAFVRGLENRFMQT